MFFAIRLSATKPLFNSAIKEIQNEFLPRRTDFVFWKLNWTRMTYCVVHPVGIGVVKGRLTAHQLENKCTHAPPVSCFSITLPGENFRSQIFWSTANSHGTALCPRALNTFICE